MIKLLYKKTSTKKLERVRVCDICGSEKEVYRFIGMYCDKVRRYVGSNMPIRHTFHTDRCLKHLKELVRVIKL